MVSYIRKSVDVNYEIEYIFKKTCDGGFRTKEFAKHITINILVFERVINSVDLFNKYY